MDWKWWATFGGVGIIALVAWKAVDSYQNGDFRPDKERLRVEISSDPSRCGAGRVEIGVTNQSSKALKSAHIQMHIFERGRSVDLAYWPTPDWDIIVQPGRMERGCLKAAVSDGKDFPSDPVYSATLESAYFYPAGQTGP